MKISKKRIFPNALTILNMFLGFVSIILIMKYDYINAGLLIILAGLMDIFDGKIEGVTKDDIDTDQLFIETDTLNGMDLSEDGTLTIPTDTTEISIDFGDYIDGMVYYNYRDGKFYRKSGKQFIPIQQPES